MILGPMIAVAMASALALPATSVVASKAGAAQTPPPAASTNPLVSLAGAGFAVIGDLMHAVPILGPLSTDIAAGAFCAAGFIPVIGDVTKASVSKFDKDQKQGNGCESSGSPFAPGGSSSAGSSSSAGKSTSGSTASDADHTSDTHRTSDANHTSDTDHTSGADHTSATDHGGASSGKHASGTVAFPDRQFQLRRDSGGKQECLVKATGSSAGYGSCDAAAAWTFQFSSGELHPVDDSATCLVASTKEFEAVTVGSCTGVTPWTSHWYLSASHRLYVRDADDHDNWRYLGAHDALVVGGVSPREFPALPVWTFAAA